MQTFLPFPDYEKSAKALDYRRLGKQRSECKQILAGLSGGGWKNHPAVKMWKGHEYQLCLYAIVICTEWRARGYKDSLLPFFLEKIKSFKPSAKPLWFGDVKFHAAHRSNLLRKNELYYSKFNWEEPKDLSYIWPPGLND